MDHDTLSNGVPSGSVLPVFRFEVQLSSSSTIFKESKENMQKRLLVSLRDYGNLNIVWILKNLLIFMN